MSYEMLRRPWDQSASVFLHGKDAHASMTATDTSAPMDNGAVKGNGNDISDKHEQRCKQCVCVGLGARDCPPEKPALG